MNTLHHDKKTLTSIGILALVLMTISVLRVVISYQTQTKIHATAVCNPDQSKAYGSKKELAVGTFGCLTPTPVPPTTAPAQPAVTQPGVTRTVAVNNLPPAANPPSALPPIDKDYHDPSCPPGEAHAFLDSRGGFMVGVYHPGDATPPGEIYDTRCTIVPVVYLYPTHPQEVSVEVKTSGHIYNSNPTYPTGGWKHVYANPDGVLTYNGETYKSLMYESIFPVVRNESLTHGIVISKTSLTPQLSDALTKYGLTNAEREDFLHEIIPVLKILPFPYLYFSLYDVQSKNLFDHLIINPKPDTEIYFSAYFKPLMLPYIQHSPLSMPQNPPKRRGFTIVEWGVLIDE